MEINKLIYKAIGTPCDRLLMNLLSFVIKSRDAAQPSSHRVKPRGFDFLGPLGELIELATLMSLE
jgi:hypothetical protein